MSSFPLFLLSFFFLAAFLRPYQALQPFLLPSLEEIPSLTSLQASTCRDLGHFSRKRLTPPPNVVCVPKSKRSPQFIRRPQGHPSLLPEDVVLRESASFFAFRFFASFSYTSLFCERLWYFSESGLGRVFPDRSLLFVLSCVLPCFLYRRPFPSHEFVDFGGSAWDNLLYGS